MNAPHVKESDWKLFRRKIADWQEAYITQLNREYIQILSREGSSAQNFWDVEKRIRKDRRKVGVECEMRRSVMMTNIISLIDEGAISLDDLQEFSDELREQVQYIFEVRKLLDGRR